jgi:hypothetical protein
MEEKARLRKKKEKDSHAGWWSWEGSWRGIHLLYPLFNL